MSSVVKQRRLTSKAIVSIAIAVISVLAIAVGAITIFALSQHTFNSSVKISYQAKDIAGKVTMYAKAAPKASNYTAKVDSEKIGEFEFTPTTDTTENPAEINMDDVELDSTDNALYLHYYFENAGTRAYTAILNYNLTDIITNQNMTLEYSESGAEGSYKNANSGLVVPGNGTKDYFVKISVTDLGLDADFEGMFTWQLNECDDSLTAMEEISLAATEFTIISEEDNTYSAKYNGGDISVTNVSGAGELSAQENTIENIWYVPSRIGTGRVISVVQGEMSYTSIPAVPKYPLPANTKVIIAESIKTLGVSAFFNHKGLKEIEIPNSITQIPGNVFEGCEGLMNVILHNNITNIGDLAFCSSGLTSIIIPNSVTEIGQHAFAGCVNLVSVILPSGLTVIKDGTFRDCKSLSEIIIPNNVTTIAYAAFDGCKSLTSIEIPNSVTSIGVRAFSNCTNLTDVYFGENATGWKVAGVAITEDLSNSKTAATCLKSTHSSKSWTK